jgi:hypothetical protein
MSYRVDFDLQALAQVDEFLAYLRNYSPAAAEKHYAAFQHVVEAYLAERPHSFAFFRETGAPYRAFLFRVSRQTSYWVIYRIYEDEWLVRVLRFWNTSREPGTHGL